MIRRALPLCAALLAVPAALSAAGERDEGAQARRGEIAYRKCYACHALEPGRNLEGPSLYRIIGRRVAAEQGFDYSPALRALARSRPRWDAALLDRYIADPEAVAPRTSMNFHGVKDRGERANLILFLRRASAAAPRGSAAAASARAR
jgi:cytochrome c2